MIYLMLFLLFVKYGLLCFGGGYMIIPLLYTDFVQAEKFFTPESYGNLLAVSQMTPGAVSINTATYVGFLKAGILGSVAATIGLCFPTFILTTTVLTFLYNYKDKPLVTGFFKGAKWAALVMILSAIFLFAKISVIDIPESFQSLSDISLNYTEIFIMLLCTIFAYKKIPFTLLLFLAALLGFGLSFI